MRQHPDVALATPLIGAGFPGGNGSVSTALSLPKDTLDTMWNMLEYVAGQQFFETFAFRPSQGRTLQELSGYLCSERGYIMTEDLLQVGWGDTDPRGKFLPFISYGDTNYVEVPGAIGPIKKRLDEKPRPFLIRSMDPAQIAWRVSSSMQVAFRLKDGVSMTRFLHDFQPWMLEHLKAGNLYANKVQCYRTMLEDQAYATNTALFRRSLALSVFFLVNLCLGVAGTFWVQTRTRREEVGVHLSFGATPRRIRAMLLLEGAVLVTLAVAVLLELRDDGRPGCRLDDGALRRPLLDGQLLHALRGHQPGGLCRAARGNPVRRVDARQAHLAHPAYRGFARRVARL